MSDYMSYVGRDTCGCIVAVVADRPDCAKDVAEDVADFIKSGLTVERVTGDVVRASPWHCPHKPEPVQPALSWEDGDDAAEKRQTKIDMAFLNR